MYLAQQCFGFSDEGMEDAIYDSQAIRRFVGIDLSQESAPDATTLLKFRRLLEEKQLTESLFQAINARLAERGLFLREGTIVDATLIAAPSSTKNQQGERDPEMHQSKKGNQPKNRSYPIPSALFWRNPTVGGGAIPVNVRLRCSQIRSQTARELNCSVVVATQA
jgi:IS5 family transposase